MTIMKHIRKSRWIAILSLISFGFAQANPTGGVVASGAANITGGAGTETITQSSSAAIINWGTFNIASGETTSFVASQANSAVLNRVAASGGESIINGTLSANETVYLINGNGILIGAGGVVNTNGFVASTRDISDSDFLAGNLNFTGNNSNGVQNLGTINALGGNVYLIGKTVDNEGTINAPNGTVGLAAADSVQLVTTNAAGQTVTVNASPTATSAAGQTAITNNGAINAAAAELRAANGNVYALAINNGGTIRATTVTQEGGDIYLTSDSGAVQNTGTLNASANVAKGQGGTVTLKSDTGTVDNTSGSILAEGGDGGTGGNVEVSGATIIGLGDLELGQGGSILLDPTNITIESNGGIDVNASETSGTYAPGTGGTSGGAADSIIDTGNLENLLNDGTSITVTTTATGGGGTDVGNITVASPVTWSGAASLTLTAANNIYINAPVTWSGVGANLNLNAGNDIAITAALSGLSGTANAVGAASNQYSALYLTAGKSGIITDTAAVDVDEFYLVQGTWDQIVGDGVSGLASGSTLPSFSAEQDFEIENSSEDSESGYGTSSVYTPSGKGLFERFAGGNGTSASPYEIADIYGLQGLGSPGPSGNYPFLISSSLNFELIDDIDASATANWRSGAGFLPIGVGWISASASTLGNIPTTLYANDPQFEGTFNGQNYAIDGLTINSSIDSATDPNYAYSSKAYAGDLTGLFEGNLGTIENLGLTNVDVTGTTKNAYRDFNQTGSLVGVNQGTITNVYVTGSVTGLGDNDPVGGISIGGLAGLNWGTIENSSANVTVILEAGNGNGSVGGLVGENSGTLAYDYSTGAVTNYGIPASSGEVQGWTGGLAGQNVGSISNSYETGSVTDLGSVGGGNYDDYTGGLVGYDTGSVSDSYSIGIVQVSSANTHAGLFIGVNSSAGNLTDVADDTDGQVNGVVAGGVAPTNDIGNVIGSVTEYAGSASTVAYEGEAVAEGTTLGFTDPRWVAVNNTSGGTDGFPTLTGVAAPPIPDPTTITLTDNVTGSATYGDTVTLTAAVTDSLGNNPTGSVIFDEDNDGTLISIGTGTLAGSGTAGTSDATLNLTLSSANSFNVGNYSFEAVYGGSGAFEASDSSGSLLALTVQQAALVITASDATKTYGTTTLSYSGGVQYTETGLVTGDTLTGVTVTSDGTAATATVTGGPYTTVASGSTGTGLSNYNITYDNGSLTINPAVLTVALTGTADKTYDGTTTATLAGNNYSLTGIVNDDTVTVSDTSAAYASANAGSGISVTANGLSLTGSAASNYTLNGVTTVSGDIGEIDKALLTLTASNQSVVQNGTVDTTATLGTTYTETGLAATDSLSTVLATGPTLSTEQSTATIGTYDNVISISATLSGSGSGNYTLDLVPGTLTVRVPVPDTTTITLADGTTGTITYGTSATLTATVDDSTTSTTTVNEGTVTFDENGNVIGTETVTGGTATLSLSSLLNASTTAYDFTASYADAAGSFDSSSTASALALTVAQAALVITASDATKTYGTTTLSYTGGVQYTETGLVNGDTLTGVTVTSSGSAATASVNGGPYTTVASGATLSDPSNYAISYVNGGLTIDPATLTLTLGSFEKTYNGTTAATLSGNYTLSGLVNDDAVTLTDSSSTYASANAGSETVTLSGLALGGSAADNYTLSGPTTLTTAGQINQALLTLTASNQTVAPNGIVKTTATLGTTYTETGLASTDSLSNVLATAPTLSSSQSTATAGSYPGSILIDATLNGTTGLNYNLDLVNGNLTVANPQAKIGSLAYQEPLSQFESTTGNANYNALFAQSNFPLGGDADDYLYIPTGSGEPEHHDYKHDTGETEGTENYAGLHVLAHASSFTVSNP